MSNISLDKAKQFEALVVKCLINKYGKILPKNKIELLNSTNFLTEEMLSNVSSKEELQGVIVRSVVKSVLNIECKKELSVNGKKEFIDYGNNLENELVEYYSNALNIKICKCLIKAIYKDILSYHPYIDKSGKVTDLDKKYYGKFKKYNNRKKLTDRQKKMIDDAEDFRNNAIKDYATVNDPKSLYEMQFWKNPILRVFFERSLWFIYLHRNTEKFKDCSNNKDFQFFENLCEYLGNNIMDSNTFEMYKNLWGLIIGRDKTKEEDIIQLPNAFDSPENVCHFSSKRPEASFWYFSRNQALLSSFSLLPIT